ncbi:hypothetical protein TNCV_4022941 [Trichonephila clavipes]|nr:hypothetical protein TNCV_4022941 [Trichonephila clavipes]
MLGRRIAARPRPPATVRDLEIALLEEWNSIPQSLINNLIASMANSIKSDLSDTDVSVSTRTTRSRLTDVRLKGRVPRKKLYLNLPQL